ncbi:MAG: hydroxymethylbilane synthase [Pseudomonadota bacterium]
MSDGSPLTIGTRSSAMAMAQTNEIVAQLAEAAPDRPTEIVRFQPRGDRDQVAKLDRHGGKGGAFVGEIRAAIAAGELKAAMHSLKDVPGDEEAPGLVFGAYLKREPVEDVLVLRDDLTADAFRDRRGAGVKIGTNSVRRAAFLQALYPDCDVIHYRGAADTRLKKLDERALQKLPDGGEVGPADALIVAKSGLYRIGREDRIAITFAPDEMIPAVGQGIVVVECVEDDWKTRETLARIDDAAARAAAMAEREMLWILDGHCNAPIAGYAREEAGRLVLDAAVLSLDGARIIRVRSDGDPARPREVGRKAGLDLLAKGAGEIIGEAAP